MARDPKPNIRENDDQPTPVRKASVGGWILAVIVVLLLVFGAISYFSNPNSPEENPIQSSPQTESQPGTTGGSQ